MVPGRSAEADRRLIPFLIFVTCFTVYGAGIVGGMNSGDQVSYALTKALVEDQTIFLDDYRRYTYNTDFSLSPDDRILCDKEPGVSLLGIPFYLAGKRLSSVTRLPYGGDHPAVNRESKLQMWTYLSVPFVAGVCFALAYRGGRRLGVSRGTMVVTVGASAFGTLMWKYATGFSRHAVVAPCLFLGTLLLLLHSQTRDARYLVPAGLLFGVASATSYVTWIPALAVFLTLGARELRVKPLARFLIGFLPLLCVALTYNVLAFGSPITSPQAHSGRFTYMHDLWKNFKTPLVRGLLLQLFSFRPIPEQAIAWVLEHPEVNAKIGGTWATRFTYKGIFAQSPVLLAAAWGWVRWWLTGKVEDRSALLYPLVCFLTILVPMSMLTQFWSPNRYDARNLLAVTPLLMLGLTGLGDLKEQSLTGRLVTDLLLFVSLLLGFASMISHFGPNLSSENRYSLARLASPGTKASLDTLVKCFPNLPNGPLLLLVATLLYLPRMLIPLLPQAARLEWANH